MRLLLATFLAAAVEAVLAATVQSAQVVGALSLAATDRAYDLAWDGTALWSLDWVEPLARRDPRDGRVLASYRYYPSALLRYGVDWDGQYLWASSGDGRASLYRIDPSSGAIVGSLRIGAHPGGGDLPAIACRGSEIWATFSGGPAGSYVGKIDSQTGTVSNLLYFEGRTFHGLAWVDTDLVASSAKTHMIYVLSPVSGEVLSEFPAPVQRGDGGPYGLAWDGHFLWVNCRPHLYRVDLRAQPTERLFVSQRLRGPQPSGLDCAWDLDVSGSTLWCADYWDRRLYKMSKWSPATLFDFFSLASPPIGIAQRGEQLWVGFPGLGSGRIVEMSTRGEEVSSYSFDHGVPAGIDVADSCLWVVGAHLGESADELVKVNPRTGQMRREMTAPGTGTIGIAWDGGSLWTADWFTDTLSHLDEHGGVVEEYELPVGRVGGIDYDSDRQTFWVVATSESEFYEARRPAGPCIFNWQSFAADGTVLLSWHMSSAEDVVRVVVERSESPTASFLEIGTLPACVGRAAFEDRSVHSGHIYYYRLTIVTPVGEKVAGPLCVPFEFEYPPIVTPVEVSDLRCEVDDGGVRVMWTMGPDALGEVQEVALERAAAEDGPFDTVVGGLRPMAEMEAYDDLVSEHRRQWYRLRVTTYSGTTSYSAAISTPHDEGSVSGVSLETPQSRGAGAGVDLNYVVRGVVSSAQLSVYDVRGRVLRSWRLGRQAPGRYSVTWDLRDSVGAPIPVGVYVVHVVGSAGGDVRKMVWWGR